METVYTILGDRIDKDGFIRFVLEKPSRIKELIEIASGKAHPHAWRAIWIVKHLCTKNDSRFKNHLDAFITNGKDHCESYQREVLNVLSKFELTDQQEGKTFDLCMSLWENVALASAVRINAFKFIAKTCATYPELKEEIQHLCDAYYTQNLSPGIHKTFLRLQKQLFK